MKTLAAITFCLAACSDKEAVVESSEAAYQRSEAERDEKAREDTKSKMMDAHHEELVDASALPVVEITDASGKVIKTKSLNIDGDLTIYDLEIEPAQAKLLGPLYSRRIIGAELDQLVTVWVTEKHGGTWARGDDNGYGAMSLAEQRAYLNHKTSDTIRVMIEYKHHDRKPPPGTKSYGEAILAAKEAAEKEYQMYLNHRNERLPFALPRMKDAPKWLFK